MAGFRTFATGEVLTAANVNNFLMKQSVMVFADASARTAALGAEVAEGMLTYNEDTGQLEVFDGAAFVPAGAEPPAGIGSNVVQTVKTNTFTTTAAVVDIPDFAVTITPSSATAKVLIIATFTVGNTTGEAYRIFINRGATQIAVGGAAAPSPTAEYFTGASASQSVGSGILVLDSPASTSATTYQVRLGRTAGTAVFNRRGDTAGAQFASLVAIEVAA